MTVNRHAMDRAVWNLYLESHTTPAAGAGFNFTTGFGQQIEIMSFHVKLVTDVNAANRVIDLTTLSGITFYASVPHSANLTASLTYQIYWLRGLGSGIVSADGSIVCMPWPTDLIINGGDQIRVNILNRQVGDQLSDIRGRYKRWLEPTVSP